MPRITVISPSNRGELALDIVRDCLKQQTLTDFEWLICSPHVYLPARVGNRWYPEPEKRKGDFYNLNKAWNAMLRDAKGEIIVFIVDNTQFLPNTLEKLWQHYINNPITCISGVGFQFDKGKQVWIDPRITGKKLHPIHPLDMEFRLASLPKRAIEAVGGIEEAYDTVVGNSEKELCLRINALGYLFLLDETLVYKFYKHEEHGEEWDKLYIKSSALLNHHANEILSGNRLRLTYVNRA